MRTVRARLASAAAMFTLATAGIHLDQKLALLHRLGVVGMQRHHRGVFAAGHRHHIARDIGIVGAFVKARVQEPVERHSR